MKAYHILLFLFIFNMFFWVTTVGLGLYNMEEEYGINPGFDLSDSSADITTIGLGVLSIFSITGHAAVDMAFFTGALVLAAGIGWTVSQQSTQGVVYGLFGWMFWTSFKNTMTLFYNISLASEGVLFIILIFTMIVGVVFVVGLFQMVTGGWKSFE